MEGGRRMRRRRRRKGWFVSYLVSVGVVLVDEREKEKDGCVEFLRGGIGVRLGSSIGMCLSLETRSLARSVGDGRANSFTHSKDRSVGFLTYSHNYSASTSSLTHPLTD
jgi:hypothetical protein